MKSMFIKLAAAASLLTASAVALAAQNCCGDLACCVQRLMACCL
ncbi:hypothetical protein [Roseateles asaccharophilus]|uniref:Uncharacterized protein n=1 Tax=Roseateles asaccharophilus TaxID=582607 RepID=A0ABU2AFL0_9BURK|nr:hypothetical protein [Roseateles asaccharophilus]MDR7335247.1 hypothetical protein [Roseateles asaccharophilus]